VSKLIRQTSAVKPFGLFPEVKAELYPVSELMSQQFEHHNEERRIMKSMFAGKTVL
jgi:hypothetical protein